MGDPTMTFATNIMKGPDDKPINEGQTVKGYKGSIQAAAMAGAPAGAAAKAASAVGYMFKAEEVSKTFPLDASE